MTMENVTEFGFCPHDLVSNTETAWAINNGLTPSVEVYHTIKWQIGCHSAYVANELAEVIEPTMKDVVNDSDTINRHLFTEGRCGAIAPSSKYRFLKNFGPISLFTEARHEGFDVATEIYLPNHAVISVDNKSPPSGPAVDLKVVPDIPRY